MIPVTACGSTSVIHATIMKLAMASACFSVKSIRSGKNHKAQGKPTERTPPISIRGEGHANAGAVPSSCFVARKNPSLLTLAFAACRTYARECVTDGQVCFLAVGWILPLGHWICHFHDSQCP